MLKTFTFSVAACVALAGCQVFEKSDTWESVVHVAPGDCFRDPDPSAAYAQKLHRVLLEKGVEHIVVTYQYHYFTHQRDEAVNTRTAVVYRDNINQHFPWWLKDDRTATPVWLPSGTLAEQIGFYIHRPAEVIEQKCYQSCGASGKAMLGAFRPASVKQRPVFSAHPHVAELRVAQAATPTPTRPPAPTHFAPTKIAAAALPTPVAAKKTHRPERISENRPKAPQKADLPSPVAAQAAPLWSPPPTLLVPGTPSHAAAVRDEKLEKVFRAQNGSSFDPSSPVDRRKMERLKQTLTQKEAPAGNGAGQGFSDLGRFPF